MKLLQDPESKIKYTKERNTNVTTSVSPVDIQTNHRQLQYALPSRQSLWPESQSYARIVETSPLPAHATSTKTTQATTYEPNPSMR